MVLLIVTASIALVGCVARGSEPTVPAPTTSSTTPTTVVDHGGDADQPVAPADRVPVSGPGLARPSAGALSRQRDPRDVVLASSARDGGQRHRPGRPRRTSGQLAAGRGPDPLPTERDRDTRVDQSSAIETTVSVWWVGVLSRDGAATPQAQWSTSSFSLILEDGDWKVTAQSTQSGTTTDLSSDSVSISHYGFEQRLCRLRRLGDRSMIPRAARRSHRHRRRMVLGPSGERNRWMDPRGDRRVARRHPELPQDDRAPGCHRRVVLGSRVALRSGSQRQRRPAPWRSSLPESSRGSSLAISRDASQGRAPPAPTAVLGTVGITVVVDLLLDLTDSMSTEYSAVSDGGALASSIVRRAAHASDWWVLTVVMGLVALVAAFLLWIELLVRSSLLYLLVALYLLVFAASVWPTAKRCFVACLSWYSPSSCRSSSSSLPRCRSASLRSAAPSRLASR